MPKFGCQCSGYDDAPIALEDFCVLCERPSGASVERLAKLLIFTQESVAACTFDTSQGGFNYMRYRLQTAMMQYVPFDLGDKKWVQMDACSLFDALVLASCGHIKHSTLFVQTFVTRAHTALEERYNKQDVPDPPLRSGNTNEAT